MESVLDVVVDEEPGKEGEEERVEDKKANDDEDI